MAQANVEDFRSKGKTLYAASKYEEALMVYDEWASAFPIDPAPLSNISVVQYQLGRYDAAIKAADRALDAQEDRSKRQALLLRKAQCHLYLSDAGSARMTAELLDESAERAMIEHKCNTCTMSSDLAGSLRQKLIAKLPRYRSTLVDELEYFYFGHDDPTSLFDDKMARTARQSCNILFGGVGDARHMFKTISAIGDNARSKQYHLTIVDISASAVARMVVILLLLTEAANLVDEKGSLLASESQLIRCVYYVFLAPIMPPGLYDVLQSKIRLAIDMLKGTIPTLPTITIAPSSVGAVLGILQQWHSEVPSKYPTPKVRAAILRSGCMGRHVESMRDSVAPTVMKQAAKIYYKSAVLVGEENGETYPSILQRSYNSRTHPSDSVLKEVDTTWKPNVTMIDPIISKAEDLIHNPLVFGESLAKDSQWKEKHAASKSLCGTVEAFFTSTSRAIRQLGPRLTIEAYVGDVNAVLESTQHPTGARRVGVEDTNTRFFDKIHLSNIPDYTGGTLTTFTYALPCLYPDDVSNVSFNCLRNTGLWRNTEHYNAEYLSLASLSSAKQAFMVLPLQTQENDGNSDFDSMFMSGMQGLALKEYQEYARISPQTSTTRLSREQFDRWLYRLFLQLAVPMSRSSETSQFVVFNPLNLTAFMRLCEVLGKNGYPSHWIDGVLTSICSGSITTSARPPRSSPMKTDEIRADGSRTHLKQSTKPFVAEMTTLLGLWQHTFSFATLCPGLPSPADIHTYQVEMQPYPSGASEKPVLALVLVHQQHQPGSQPGRLRKFLLDDEEGLRTKSARLVRENINFVSMCNIEHGWKDGKPDYPFTATFWMGRDFMNNLQASGGWSIAIWRTDEWSQASRLVSLSKVRDKGVF